MDEERLKREREIVRATVGKVTSVMELSDAFCDGVIATVKAGAYNYTNLDEKMYSPRDITLLRGASEIAVLVKLDEVLVELEERARSLRDSLTAHDTVQEHGIAWLTVMQMVRVRMGMAIPHDYETRQDEQGEG